MPTTFPRREKPAAKVGPRLEISPLEIKAQLENQHGLSSLICAAETWEVFAWKGNELTAPMRALYSAEAQGLLNVRNDRCTAVPVADIAADINHTLLSLGRSTITENTVLRNLRTASTYCQAAVGVSVIPNSRDMTVRLVDKYESAQNIETYFKQMEAKMQKLSSQLKHAQAMDFPVDHLLSAVEEKTGIKLLAGQSKG